MFDGSIDEDAFEYCIDDFSDLPDEFNGAVFVGEDFDGFKFFSTEEDLIHAFEKDASDSCGEYWNNLNDELLNEWYKRLFVENQLFELPIDLGITDEII